MRIRRLIALLMCVIMTVTASACGETTGSGGQLRIVKEYEVYDISIAFRQDDYVINYVDAAIKELTADGTTDSIAVRWGLQDSVDFPSDEDALDVFEYIPWRRLLVGVEADAMPLSYVENGEYVGFDVEMVKAVCEKLGWEYVFIPIDAVDTYVELSSGNIDCAWGGLAIDRTDTRVALLDSYTQNALVVVVRSDSGIRTEGGLDDMTLAVDADQSFMELLDADAGLRDSLGKVSRLTGGTAACFEALWSGEADAIIVHRLAAQYYGR